MGGLEIRLGNIIATYLGKDVVLQGRPDSHMARKESGQIPIRLWCCKLSSRVLNRVGVNMIGTCSEKAGFH